jgi:hypothetical protein
MAIEARSAEFIRDTEYEAIKRRFGEIEAQTQKLVDRATVLHGDSPADDKVDILALRTTFIANMSAILA